MKKNVKKSIDYTKFRDKPFKFMYFVAEEYRWSIMWTIIFIAVSEIVFSGIVVFLGRLTDTLEVADIASADRAFDLAVILIGIFAVSFACWRISSFIGTYLTTRLEAKSINITFKYLIQHSHTYFSDRLVGKLSSKISNIASSIEIMFPMIFWDILRTATKFVVICIIAFVAHFWLGMIFAIFIIIFILINIVFARKLVIYSKKQADKMSVLRGNVVDDLTNVMAIKQNVRMNFEVQKIEGHVDNYRVAHLKTWRYFQIVVTINSAVAVGMFAAVTFGSLQLWEAQKIGTGIVVMAVVMAMRLIGDLVFMGAILNRFMDQYGQLKEGLKEIFVHHDIVDAQELGNVNIENGEILFDEVTFQYEDDDTQSVFENLTLSIPPGQKIGLVGESGAGKSTLVSLLLRFVDVDSGKITIDGYDIREMHQDNLRGAIAYVPQDALLFHRTVEENIKYSNEKAGIMDVKEAATRAHAIDFINQFPQKLDTFVGERGVKLSGGQKQRVMIARAMLKESPILVLDEATSSLDSHSEQLIQEALEQLMKGRTTIVIAHRLSTLKQMDRIIVFDGGKIVEDGTHEELLEKKGKYFELWQHQTGALN